MLAGKTPVLVHNTCSSNAKILGENMEAAGTVRPPETAAHHIVASTSPKAAAARQQLAKFGIDINDADNGVFLPRGSASVNPSGASVHSRIHTNDYYTYVNDMIGGARNADEARDVLGYLRSQLQGGYWP
ncbi:AHH domain-containing protein [Streptomyces broussonetiae]|nr:AHH domain-containing protein [Streptomyces broussonetiae]